MKPFERVSPGMKHKGIIISTNVSCTSYGYITKGSFENILSHKATLQKNHKRLLFICSLCTFPTFKQIKRSQRYYFFSYAFISYICTFIWSHRCLFHNPYSYVFIVSYGSFHIAHHTFICSCRRLFSQCHIHMLSYVSYAPKIISFAILFISLNVIFICFHMFHMHSFLNTQNNFFAILFISYISH